MRPFEHFQGGSTGYEGMGSGFDGDKWSVKYDVRDLGGHLDTTFRGWSATLVARVRLAISRLVLIFALSLDFHGRVRVVRRNHSRHPQPEHSEAKPYLSRT